MFCPTCGVRLSGRVESCTSCHADLRALVATGFFTGLPAADTPLEARPTAQESWGSADATVLSPVDVASIRDVAPDDLTALAGTPIPSDDSDPDATRLGTPEFSRTRTPRPDTTDRASARFTPRSTPQPPSGGTAVRPRTGVAGSAIEGPLHEGQNFGNRYHIIRLLGIGGMGAVYQAWDSELEVALAFKVIRPDATADPDVAAEIEGRFKRELLLARQVTHPNVVRIHDLGEIEGIKYITMPYIEGRDLSDILAEAGTLPVPRVLRIARQIASGLCAAHDAGVVHRDLKPANIMIDAEDHALIMDFGIARAQSSPADAGRAPATTSRAAGPGVTRLGTVVGTIEYMAPEQARAEPVDHRADIYAVGMIVHRMLGGPRLPDGALDAVTDLLARMKAEPKRLREINPDLPDAVEAIVSRCLQPDPAARYQTTAELLAALEALDENGIPLPEPLPIWRSWRFWSAAASLTAVLISGTWWIAQIMAPDVPVQRDPVSVLIADFTNGTGDAMFNGLLEQSLGVGLEGASFVTAYDRRAALRVARQLKAGTALDDKVAQLVAQREGVKVVLAGGIVPDGAGYKLSVRGINPADGTPTLNSTVRVGSKSDVLTGIGRLAGDIRKSLGDTKTARTPAANEMLSASSLEAVAEYIKGQELTRQTRDAEAIPHFRRATELDPNFGRAYSAWGTAANKLGHTDEAEQQYTKARSLLDRMTEREKYRTLGVYYLGVSKDYDKAIESFGELVKLYPSDAAAYNNLAVAYTNKRDFKLASENGRKALEIYPKNLLYRSNYALYSMYAGDFKSAETEANRLLEEDPKYFMAYLPLAMEALSRGDTPAARAFYARMGAINANAASLANIGLADVAVVEGHTAEAIDLLGKGVAADLAAKSEANAAVKRMATAEAYELDGQLERAVSAAQAAVAMSTSESILVPAGRIFAAVRRQDAIDDVARMLGQQFEPQKRAYARILDALEYMNRGRYVDAVDSLNAAIKFADLWLARFYLGLAYEAAGRHTEALYELEICQKRRGEATALFFDEVPTFRYVAPLPYWLARAQQGLGQATQARTNYKAYLDQKKGASDDALVADAQRRLDSLTVQ
jgi:serine/threonine protein kinase/tetratricopeptide (TPR) repeat protein